MSPREHNGADADGAGAEIDQAETAAEAVQNAQQVE